MVPPVRGPELVVQWNRRAVLTWHTMIALPPAQVGWRLLRLAQRRLPRRAPPVESPAIRTDLRALVAEVRQWAPLDVNARRTRASRVMQGEFDFVGTSRHLNPPDWLAGSVSPLWTYNLHYFDFAVDLAWAAALDRSAQALEVLQVLLGGWIASPAGGQGPGWAPYPTSVRVANWVKVLLVAGNLFPPAFRERVAASLHAQLGHLRSRIEWDLRGNHLQRNLTSLVVGSLLFDGPRPAAWRRDAGAWLWEALATQILDDGGHYERSPMYHAIALQDLLETALLLRAAGEPVPPFVSERIGGLASALGNMVRPDGTLHLFNDAADGIAATVADLETLAARAGTSVARRSGAWSLPETGYFGYRDAVHDHSIVVDAGPPGPREQPGHAHCDLLSFELDIAGVPFVVDSGVHGYDGDPFREYSRSTRAHNTVMLGGREQSECWGTFRLARRAVVLDAAAVMTDEGWSFVGAYSPYYDRLVRHARQILWHGDEIRVRDEIQGSTADALSFVHLHPSCQVETRGGRILVAQGAIRVEIMPFGAELVDVYRGVREPGRAVQGWYLQRFGSAVAAPVLVFRAQAARRPFGYNLRFHEA